MKDILHALASVPVIFLSAYGQEDVVANALDMGAADYVSQTILTRLNCSPGLGQPCATRNSIPPSTAYTCAMNLAIDYAENAP